MGALDTPCDAPNLLMLPVMGAVMDVPHDCKTILNIDTYPSTLVFVENIGHNYILRGVGWSLVWSGGGGGWFRSKENNTYLLTVNV